MKRPALYFRMPRVASATITRLLQTRCSILPHAMRPELVRHCLAQNKAAFRFTFVRHPYTRFASALRWARREWDPEQHPFDGYELAAVRDLSDLEVAKQLPLFCAGGLMIHFFPQSSFIFNGDRCLVSEIGRYEQLSTYFDHIADYLGVDARIEIGENRIDCRLVALKRVLHQR